MTYKITQRCVDLVEELFNAGYAGEAKITNCYASGAKQTLGDNFSIELSDFCKETLCFVEDVEEEELVFVGRYDREYVTATVEGIVDFAWDTYKSYKTRGYSMPYAFENLFKKHGYLMEKKVPATSIWEECR